MVQISIANEMRANFDRLMRLHRGKERAEVVRLANELIPQSPDFYPFYVLRGSSLMELGDHAAALADFQKALELGAGDAESLKSIGICLHALGRARDAIPYLADSFHKNPTAHGATVLIRAALEADDRNLVDLVFKSAQSAYFEMFPSQATVMAPYVPIHDWCAANGIALEVFDAGGEIRLTSLKGEPIEPYTAQPLEFATIPNAVAVAGLDWIIAPSGEVLEFRDYRVQGFANNMVGWVTLLPFCVDGPRRRVLYPRSTNEIHIDEDAVFLSAPLENHFGHWIFDYLPRLMARITPGKPPRKVFTTAALPKAHREVLERFGIPPEDIIEGETGIAYRFRSLTAPAGIFYISATPSIPSYLYEKLAPIKEPAAPGAVGGRYYLERSQNARGRNIVNQRDLDVVLNEFGFKTVRRPELSVDEQDALFSEADIILTPFGTDLLTWFQVRPATDFVVLEFEDMAASYQGQEQIAPRYCAILGMYHHSVPSKSVDTASKRIHKADLVVDCDALRSVLLSIVHRRSVVESDKKSVQKDVP